MREQILRQGKNDTSVTNCATKSQKMQNEIFRKINLTGSRVVNIHRKEEYCTISSGVEYRKLGAEI